MMGPNRKSIAPKNKKARTPRHRQNKLTSPELGIQTAQASNFSGPKVPLDSETLGFIESYVDPCGVHRSGLDVKKIKDAAFPVSAVAEYRFIDTIARPGRDLSSTDLVSGANMSQLYLLTPLLRAPLILLVNLLSQEFSDEIMAAFGRAWAGIASRDSATFPNWVSFNTDDEPPGPEPVNWFTVLSPDTLQSLDAPNELGISSVLKSYRFVSQGVDIRFNVPDLINQATAVMARVAADVSSIEPIREHVRGYDEFYLQWSSLPNPIINAFFPGGASGSPINELSFSGVFPSPVLPATTIFRNGTGTFRIDIGDLWQYQTNGSIIYLVNLSSSTRVQLRDWSASAGSLRMYYRGALDADIPINEVRSDMTKMVLPPVLQKDMQAQIVSTTSYLMKDDEGVYLNNQIWRPIFDPQSATSFKKIIFVNELSNLADLDDPNTGWYDSYDKNFGFAMVNIQGMSQTAAPLVKMIRTDEQVPSKKSIVGAYTTRCTGSNPIALQVAQTMVDRLPMGFPASFNGMGKLFSMVTTALKHMPLALAHAMNLTTQISDLVDSVGELDTIGKNPRRVRVTRERY